MCHVWTAGQSGVQNEAQLGQKSCFQLHSGKHNILMFILQWTYSNLHLLGILPLCYLHLQFILTQQQNKVINQLASSKPSIPLASIIITYHVFVVFFMHPTDDSTPWVNIITILGYLANGMLYTIWVGIMLFEFLCCPSLRRNYKFWLHFYASMQEFALVSSLLEFHLLFWHSWC